MFLIQMYDGYDDCNNAITIKDAEDAKCVAQSLSEIYAKVKMTDLSTGEFIDFENTTTIKLTKDELQSVRWLVEDYNIKNIKDCDVIMWQTKEPTEKIINSLCQKLDE